MSEATVMALARDALQVVVLVTAPILGLGLLAGLVVSLFQAATQIHEQTLAFIPKILAVMIALFVFGPWMLRQVLDFTHRMFDLIPTLVR